METQDALEMLKELQEIHNQIGQIAGRYAIVAQALRDPLHARIDGGPAPMGYGNKHNIDSTSVAPLSEVKDLLNRYQSAYDALKSNVPSIADSNVQNMIGRQLEDMTR